MSDSVDPSAEDTLKTENPPAVEPAPEAKKRPPWTVALPAYDADALPRLLPRLEEIPEFSLRDDVEDFRVDEVPLYPASGEGEHLYVHVEKTGVSTPQVVVRLTKALGIRERDVGFAGRKDERGVTSQWFSVPKVRADAAWGAVLEDDAAAAAGLLGDGVKVLARVPHKNKLRLGHLAGNRFRLVLRAPTLSAADAATLCETLTTRAAVLEKQGMPAYFGAQRFGHNSESLRQAEQFLERGRPARSRKETFWVSIVQSALCNLWIAQRLAEGRWNQAEEGEVLLTRKGGPFWCDDPVTDSGRLETGEVSSGAPMFGKKMRSTRGAAMTRESRFLEGLGIDPLIFETHPAFATGERRPHRTFPSEIQVTQMEGAIQVEFTLPPGAYATVLLDELVGQSVRDGAFWGP